MTAPLLVHDATLRTGRRVDICIDDGLITEVAAAGGLRHRWKGEAVDADGALLLPGLHDHHLHVLATAAADTSVPCGPPEVTNADQLRAGVREAAAQAPDGRWVRGVGYHESVAGDLDRDALDDLAGDVPVRVQHRSGALWILNSPALDQLGVDEGELPNGIERDVSGRPTGRLWRADNWLRDRLGPEPPPDLRALGAALADRGVTGVTDATPDLGEGRLDLLLQAVATGAMPQRLHLLGVDRLPDDLPRQVAARVTVGPRKMVLADHDLPTLPDLVAQLHDARHTSATGVRPVAVHCVTRLSLILLCAAFAEVGTVPGDRIEHASVVPAELLLTLRGLGVTVVTQPGLVAHRGDEYLRDVNQDDLAGLYRHASLMAAGIPVGLSTDAPYTPADPWGAMQAAVHRRTPKGHVVGPDEAVNPDIALDGFLTPHDHPGDQPRTVSPGAAADLMLVRMEAVTAHVDVVGASLDGRWHSVSEGS